MKVGIDIGNKQSKIAIMKPDGSLLSIPDATFGNRLETPSSVCLENETVLIGLPAAIKLTQETTIPHCLAFKQATGSETVLFTDNKQQNWYVETLLTLLLKKLKYDCETFCGSPIESAVLTIPGYFNEKEKKALLIAASLADIPVLDLIPEATAVACAYTAQSKIPLEGLFLVYDFGDSSLDVSLLNLTTEGEINLLEEQRSTEFGATLLSQKIKTFLMKALEKDKGKVLDYSPYCLQQLEKITAEVLISLTDASIFYLKKQITVGKDQFTLLLDRSELEQSIAPIIEESLNKCLEELTKLTLSPTALEGILLTGGITALPMVAEKMAKKFDIDSSKIHLKDPLKAVSFGAAVYAQEVVQNLALPDLPKEFKGISGHNIGLKTFSSELGSFAIDTIFEQNLPLPCKGSRIYYFTPEAGQSTVLDLVVYEQDQNTATSVGKMVINSILNTESNQAIEVEFTNTVLGTIELTAYCRQTGEEIKEIFPYLTVEDQRILAQRQLIMEVLANDFI